MRLDLSGAEHGQIMGSRKHDNGPLCSIKGDRKISIQLSDY
jgi:hypothetical protein